MVGKLLGRLNSFLRIFFHILVLVFAKVNKILKKKQKLRQYFCFFAVFDIIFADFETLFDDFESLDADN